MRRIAATLLLIGAFNAQADFQDAVQALHAGDYDTAMKEYKALADTGDASGEFGVAYMHHYGYGVRRDSGEAMKWFQSAADKGHVPARQYLAILNHKGEGAQKDLVTAHMWYTLYAKDAPNERDRAYTLETLGKIERRMTPEQITQAKKMAVDWKPKQN